MTAVINLRYFGQDRGSPAGAIGTPMDLIEPRPRGWPKDGSNGRPETMTAAGGRTSGHLIDRFIGGRSRIKERLDIEEFLITGPPSGDRATRLKIRPEIDGSQAHFKGRLCARSMAGTAVI